MPPVTGMKGQRYDTANGQALVFTGTGAHPRQLVITGAAGKAAQDELYSLAMSLRWNAVAKPHRTSGR